MTTAGRVPPSNPALPTFREGRSGFPSLPLASPISLAVSKAPESFTCEPHDSARSELDDAVRFDLDTTADLLELLPVVEIGTVLALQVLQHESVSIHC